MDLDFKEMFEWLHSNAQWICAIAIVYLTFIIIELTTEQKEIARQQKDLELFKLRMEHIENYNQINRIIEKINKADYNNYIHNEILTYTKKHNLRTEFLFNKALSDGENQLTDLIQDFYYYILEKRKFKQGDIVKELFYGKEDEIYKAIKSEDGQKILKKIQTKYNFLYTEYLNFMNKNTNFNKN